MEINVVSQDLLLPTIPMDIFISQLMIYPKLYVYLPVLNGQQARLLPMLIAT